jgi:hypothetical protein
LTHDVNRAIEQAAKLDYLDAFTIGFTSSARESDEVLAEPPWLSAS